MLSARSRRRLSSSRAKKAAITTARSTTRASARPICGIGLSRCCSRAANILALLRPLDVVVTHHPAPARNLALEHGARRRRRAFVLWIRQYPSVGPLFGDGRIGNDLLQRGIELVDHCLRRAGRCELRMPVEDLELRSEPLHETLGRRNVRCFLRRGEAKGFYFTGFALLHHLLRRGEEDIDMTA